MITITLFLLRVDPLLALLAAGLLGGLYTAVYFRLKQKLVSLGSTLVVSNKNRYTAANEVFGGIKNIKLLGREQIYLSHFQNPSRELSDAAASQRTLSQVPKYIIEAFAFGGIILIVLILMSRSGGLSSTLLGQILPIVGIYTFSAYRLQPALQNVFKGVASLRFGQALVDNLHAGLLLKNKKNELPKKTPKSLSFKDCIKLHNLSYSYPNTKKKVLMDLNLQIPAGTSIGIIGSTGAGKTTLVDLVLGLLRPTKGKISIDGMVVTDERIREWQQSLGYVPQEIYLTDKSIYENIAFGIPKENINLDQVKHCASMAQVHDFIMYDLPLQYDTLVGERGVRLSGGQCQRIGIARALYHNPAVLLFDEATSALDMATEAAVMRSIDSLVKQKTIIIIAHRLSTVKNCDQIVVLEKGKIKAIGSYNQILETGD